MFALFSVKLMEGLHVNCSPYFPQYFTNAILLGVCHPTLPWSGMFKLSEAKKCFGSIFEIWANICWAH